ncbi:MAG: right-handed parallel beta-helix repeat-containing protein [Methanothrix sp.]|uniref:right-handed parallel beta-helix repeat-containing protein n=1 Tax=Methanothrix sp. TaxID=90426 RepID=UPI0025DC073E|nr:NosD domain-containing protein [Methanothrix sp.]MCQ8903333.1 right-handed parallel beta-helix repeat-containing protein [Methanothrix sp.]
MSMAWPWSSLGCATSGTEQITALRIAIVLALLSSPALAVQIPAGHDVQSAIDSASPGDVLILEAGQHRPFVVDRPLTLIGYGAFLSSDVQSPAITVRSDNVRIEGLSIAGVKRPSEEKFKYYMERYQGGASGGASGFSTPATASGPLRLDLPNAAVLVFGSNVTFENMSVRDAEVGIFAEDLHDLFIDNSKFQSCKTGVLILRSSSVSIINSELIGCEKAGLNASNSRSFTVTGCRAINNTHAGLFFRNCEDIDVIGNTLSRNSEGLVFWSTNHSSAADNRADLNYYGILLADSHNNTISRNILVNNRRSEIVSGFGVGMSIQANSSYNLVFKNTASNNYNGLEITENCQRNALCGNNISRNTHGVRLDKNWNNLIYRNNFVDNVISGYDNQTRSIWNTTVGNHYSDYRGSDGDGDGIGDTPYTIPKGSSMAADYRPLVRPFTGEIDPDEILEDIKRYARYDPEEGRTIRVNESGAAIRYPARRGPPVFEENAEIERPPFTPVL